MRTIEQIEAELRRAKIDRKSNLQKITGANNIYVISDNFISMDCEDLAEVKKVLLNLDPYINGWEITKGINITSLYKITIVNDYYNRSLKIEFENATGVKYWVSIDFNKLPESFKDAFFVETKRALYDTEQVYVNTPSHYKKYKDIRIQAFSFPSTGQQVSFYGGNKVCRDEKLIYEIIETIKK